MKKCPYRFGLPEKKQGCIQHDCEFFINLVGTHPQTGETQNEWGCSLRWLPILLVENASRTRQASASVDKVANEVRRQSETIFGLASDEAKARLLNADPSLKQIEQKGV